MDSWWAAFVLGMFCGSLLTVFFLSVMKSGARADREMEMAMKEYEQREDIGAAYDQRAFGGGDDKKASK